MASVIDLYDKLSNAPDDRARARIIAEAFEELEDRYPHLGEMATQSDVRESELRLQREIEKIRQETAETKLSLTKEIEGVRLQVEQVRADLTKEIAQVRADLGRDIEKSRAQILVWTFAFWATQLAAIFFMVWRLSGTP